MTAHPSNVDPQPTTAPITNLEPDSEAADFLERLGDLDQFIGAAEPSATQLPPFTGGRNTSPPTTRRLFEAPGVAAAATDTSADSDDSGDDHHSDEQADFLQRLGDLDRFISPGQPEPTAPAVAAGPSDAATGDDDADDFLQRLGDLDRFIGPGA